MSRKNRANPRAQAEVKTKQEVKPKVIIDTKPPIKIETKTQPKPEPKAQVKIETPQLQESSASERVRREWRSFQTWFEARHKEEEKRVQDMLVPSNGKGVAGRPASKATTGSKLPDSLSSLNVLDRIMVELVLTAREEWEVRLDKTGLQPEAWTDMTPAEMEAVESTLGLPDDIEAMLLGLPPQVDVRLMAEKLSANPLATSRNTTGSASPTTQPKQPSPLRQSTSVSSEPQWADVKAQLRNNAPQSSRTFSSQNGRASANTFRRDDSESNPAWTTWAEKPSLKVSPRDAQPQNATKPTSAGVIRPSATFAATAPPTLNDDPASYISPVTLASCDLTHVEPDFATAIEDAVRQFHAAAAEADIELAKKLYSGPVDAPFRARLLHEHQQAMERLARQTMEKQRAVYEAERTRRTNESRARDRLQTKTPINSTRYTLGDRPTTPASARRNNDEIPRGAFMSQESDAAFGNSMGFQSKDKKKGKWVPELEDAKQSEPAGKGKSEPITKITASGRRLATPSPAGSSPKPAASTSRRTVTVSEELDPDALKDTKLATPTASDKSKKAQGSSSSQSAKSDRLASQPPIPISRSSSGQPQTIPPDAWGTDEDEDEDGDGGLEGIFQFGTSALAAPELLASLSSDSDSPLTSPKDSASWGLASRGFGDEPRTKEEAGKGMFTRSTSASKSSLSGFRDWGQNAKTPGPAAKGREMWIPAPADASGADQFLNMAMANLERKTNSGDLEDALKVYVTAKQILR